MKSIATLLLLLSVGCTNNAIPTPTRVLDLPSDVALFCVDVEYNADSGVCPTPLDRVAVPSLDADEGTLRGFLDYYCTFVPPVSAVPPSNSVTGAKVLTLNECSDVSRQRQREAVQGPLLDIAVRLGRSRDFPCCEIDDTTCGLALSACKVRKLEALVTNSARGEVALVDTTGVTAGLNTAGQIQNLHSGRPGFGFLPAGVLPDHVRTDAPPRALAQGAPSPAVEESPAAYAVVTNLGSCDLSVIGLSRVTRRLALVNPSPPPAVPSPATCEQFPDDDAIESCRVIPWVGDATHPLGGSPSYVEIAPWGDRRALVTYPRCGLVAEVNLRSGKVEEALSFSAGTPRRLSAAELAALRCPAECGGGDGSSMLPAVDVSGALAAPSALAVDKDGQRLLISDALSTALTLVDFDPKAVDGQHLSAPRRLALDFPAGTTAPQRGVDGVRVGPRTGAGLFAYARARDATVRVINLDTEQECETNPDPRYLQGEAARGNLPVLPDDLQPANLRRFACFPVGTTLRSPLASSAGIGLPGGAVPTDVAFVQYGLGCDPGDPLCGYNNDIIRDSWVVPNPQLWVGDFAWILGSNGRAQAVQIADRCTEPSYRACDPGEAAKRRIALLNGQSPAALRATGTLDPASYAVSTAISVTALDRLGNVRRNFSSRFIDSSLGPRIAVDAQGVPLVNARVDLNTAVYQTEVTRDDMSKESRLVLPTPTVYPSLPVDPVCDAALTTAVADSDFRPRTLAAFPNPAQVSSESWSLEWEGLLEGMNRVTGRLAQGAGQGTLVDLSGLYCSRGVEPGDKVFLPGCFSDAECPGTICAREPSRSTSPGVCVKNTAAGEECRRLSRSLTTDPQVPGQDPTVWAAAWTPRYRVLRATDGTGGSALRLGEIAAPEFSVQQTGCTAAELGAACSAAGVHLPATPTPLARDTVCRIDHDQQDAKVYRCTVDCDNSNDCGTGYVCAPSPYAAEERGENLNFKQRGRCVRAPLIRAQSGWVTSSQAPVNGGAASYVVEEAGDRADEVLEACFPELLRYQVRAGDAFLVRGGVAGAPTFTRAAAPDGHCARPTSQDKVEFQASRLQQPRLPLGPRKVAVAPGLACPPQPPVVNKDPAATKWISHRPAPPAAFAGTSCERLFNGDFNQECQVANVTPPFVCLPTQTAVRLPFQRASAHISAATVNNDPWLLREYELFSSLTADRANNSCILTGESEEERGACTLPGETGPCTRRIHYENASLNLVMQLPRLTLAQQSTRVLVANEWVVPDDNYTVSFVVTGGALAYALPVAVSAGQLAQGLHSAAAAPDGAVFVVDQGRTGSAVGLRGQLMRLVRGVVDANFLVR